MFDNFPTTFNNFLTMFNNLLSTFNNFPIDNSPIISNLDLYSTTVAIIEIVLLLVPLIRPRTVKFPMATTAAREETK